jgi:hypothetical protein
MLLKLTPKKQLIVASECWGSISEGWLKGGNERGENFGGKYQSVDTPLFQEG